MADPEIIDLTDSPVLVASAGSKDIPVLSLFQNQDVLSAENIIKRQQRRRKKKYNRSVRNRDPLAATTKNASNEESEEADASQDPPQAKRVHRNRSLTPEIDTSSPIPRDRISSLKRHKHREDQMSSTGNTDLNEDLYFEDTIPASLPSAVNLPPPPYDTANPPSQNSTGMKLLLPAHVSVFGSAAVEILPPTDEDEDDADYIKFLDYGGERQKVSSNGFDVLGACSLSTGVSAVF